MSDAATAFIASKSAIDRKLAALAAHSEDHFGTSPDGITYGDVGKLAFVDAKLGEILEFLGIRSSSSS